MKRLLKIKYIVLASCLGFLFNGCVDDGLGFSADELRDGETTVMLDVSFSPFSEGNLTRANIENGNGKLLSDLKDLCILVYDAEGGLVEGYPREVTVENLQEKDRTDADASNGKTAEASTKTLSGLTLNLPFGRYYIVAVANLKEGTLTTLNNNAETINSLEGLRRMKVEWDNTNIENNSELMGYFTDTEMKSGVPSAINSFSTVSVNRPGMKLQAWLRRCASKITIDFDGSKLRDNVTVYIQKAVIKDIPFDCTLGFGQGASEGIKSYNHRASYKEEKEDGLIETSKQVISFLKAGSLGEATETVEGDDFVKPDVTNWTKLTKGMPVIKDNMDDKGYEIANVINFHSENADALYFYENMQENPENKTKIPHADLVNGGVANSDVKKDGIPFGTYIEVTGYYESNADGNYSHGNIKYRFMLGKNVTDNFEAERNYHYKLTLCPRGNGNDADWHIDFDEPKGFHVPNPWYVSYLYNHDAMLPFKYTPPKGYELTKLEAEIIKNPWYPSPLSENELTDPNINIDTSALPYGDDPAPYTESRNKNDGNGFLSLRETDKVVIYDTDARIEVSGDNGHAAGWPGYGKAETPTINEAFYKGDNTNSKGTIDRSKRTYYFDGTADDTNTGREEYTYIKEHDSYSFNIPLFTRAKIMVKQTGYSGNNPFVGYQRVARVKLTATIREIENPENVTTEDQNVNVVQVRRVVNPKGVYRATGNSAPFHVRMMWLNGDESSTFTDVISHGSWMAEIIGDKNFITLDGKQTVSGAGDTPIDFTIRFNRMSSGNKNAVVRIKYHNYTCTHLIFVRQGYDAQVICGTGKQYPLSGGQPSITTKTTKWSTFNMITKDTPATDPRDEGSMFKFGNYKEPIASINNAYKDANGQEFYTPPTKDDFFDKTPDSFILATEGEKSWSDIKYDPKGFDTTEEIGKVATMRDFEQLYLSDNVQFGYGVLYADGATETQYEVNMAYGFFSGDKSSNAKQKGMRGLFAYYWDRNNPSDSYNGRNLFFPIGRSGYGHRKNSNEEISATENHNGIGVLRYSATRALPSTEYTWPGKWTARNAGLDFPQDAPLFVSLYRKSGAIYWAKKSEEKYLQWNGTIGTEGTAYGLDINYYSFDVNSITAGNVSNGEDACFVRTVVDN